MNFKAEVSETATNFLDTTVYKGERFKTESVLDVRTHFKPIETFHCTHFQPAIHLVKKKRLHQRRASTTYFELTLLKHYLKRASQTSKHIFLREDTQKILFKRPSQKLLLKTGIKPSNKNKTKKENPVLCNAISPSSA